MRQSTGTLLSFTVQYLILLFLPLTLYSQNNAPFLAMDSLFLVSGKPHNDTKNSTSNVQCFSDGKAITVNITVKTNEPTYLTDSVKSDHVEVWFAFGKGFENDIWNRTYSFPSSVITSDSGYFYLSEGNDDVDALRKEIADPLIEASNYDQDSLQYSNLDTTQWSEELSLKNKIDAYLSNARTSHLKKENVFFGITHFGLLPQQHKAVLYDKENYTFLEKHLGVQLRHDIQSISIRSQVTDSGYTIEAVFPPEAIGFSQSVGIRDLRLMVDVIHHDKTDHSISMYSTSQDRKWDNPKTFTDVSSQMNPVQVSLIKSIPELGEPTVGNTITSNALQELQRSAPNFYLYTTNGWIPVEVQEISFNRYDRPSSFFLPRIMKYRYTPGIAKSDSGSNIFGTHTLRKFTFTNGEYILIDNTLIFSTDEIINTFQLPDSSVCAIYTICDTSGNYGLSSSEIYLITTTSPLTPELLLQWGTTGLYVHGKTELTLPLDILDSDLQPEIYENIDWKNRITLENNNLSIIVKVAENKRIRVSWDEHGGNIRAELLY